MADHSDASPLMPPKQITEPSEIDLEAGPGEQIQCRICLESDGRDFIAPCKCKGTSKYVHRECLDHWRAVKVIASLAYLVYLIDALQQFWLRLAWGFDSELSFYYICGKVSSYNVNAYARQINSDKCYSELYCFSLCLGCLAASLHVTTVGCATIWLSHVVNYAFVAVNLGISLHLEIFDPVVFERCNLILNNLCSVCADCHLPGTLCMWTDCTTCWGSCASMAGECGCLGGAGEAGLPILFIMALIVLGLFTVIGIFYSVLVATMVGQRIWQRHYHILAKRMLTKEYVVEDVDGEITGSDWSPPPLPAEHIQQLKTLGLL
ncbi:unnamed protein product [Malus baccata var. baccata]|uniref:RING-CH-type domain-containing protein n=1 Tax=Malus domestica TaxID=3750 RepID=A0A498HW52_MALDO|nr:hypothetical protein DVH24_039375 [Malus domestica]